MKESLSLFDQEVTFGEKAGACREKLKRLDLHGSERKRILPLCRLKHGEIWDDPIRGHRVGLLDATRSDDVRKLVANKSIKLSIDDPPYNIAVGNANTDALSRRTLSEYIQFSEQWVRHVAEVLAENAHLYVWLGADYRDSFQPLPDFMLMMRKFSQFSARNLITMRNQRGYGTQKNWMWVRQELLYYTTGCPKFNVAAEYTDIPKVLRGYYKEVNGKTTENIERSKSEFIRAGNVWVDIQQVFYRLEENVPGCYAQKPLKAIERIVASATDPGDVVLDCFSHSGTTLVAGERLHRSVLTLDNDPVFAEITIRRLERYRATRKTGWQWETPFPELEQKSSRWT